MFKQFIAAAMLSAVLPAHAEILMFDFTGVISTVIEQQTTPNGTRDKYLVSSTILPGGVAIGDTFSGRLSYDTAAPIAQFTTPSATLSMQSPIPATRRWQAAGVRCTASYGQYSGPERVVHRCTSSPPGSPYRSSSSAASSSRSARSTTLAPCSSGKAVATHALSAGGIIGSGDCFLSCDPCILAL